MDSALFKTNGANVILHRRLNPGFPQEILMTKSVRGPWVLPGGEVDYDTSSNGNEPYLDAAIREVHEELGLDIKPEIQAIELIAICQQRKILNAGPKEQVTKINVIGTVLLYALGINIDLSDLKPQPAEVSAIEWWSIDRILRDQGVALGYRRMVAVFLEKSLRYHPRPVEINLGNIIRVPCSDETIVI